jgi:transposase
LQVIKDAFADYVREKGISYISFCADDGETYGLHVWQKRDSCVAKLGRNYWRLLLDVLNFKAGDVIRFKFGPDDRCYLYKISPMD